MSANRAFRLTLEYDGTEFKGWQVQPRTRTVQGELEAALATLLGHPVRVHGSGRTDAGVHALGQVAHLHTDSAHDAERIRHSLNALLPRDVSVVGVEAVSLGFHARKDALGKRYRYHLLNRPSRSAVLVRTAWHVPQALDWGAIGAALGALLGTHDFAAFCSANATTRTTVRTITRAEAVPEGGGLYSLHFEGSGFLKYMVRSLVGTLVQVGLGKVPVSRMAALLAPGPRSLAGPTAPSHGLCLMEVRYGRSDPDAPAA